MTFRLAAILLPAACVFLAPACQPEPTARPAPTLPLPPPPPPSTAPEPAEENYLVPGFTGLYVTPGQPLVIAEGSSVFVDVNWVGGGSEWREPVTVRIVSGAPPSELTVEPSLVEFGPGAENAGAIFLSAVADDRDGEAPATYTVQFGAGGRTPDGWAWDLSRAEMQVTVVEAEPSLPGAETSPSACSQTSLQAVAHGETRDAGGWMRAVHGDDLGRYLSGDIRLRAAHPGSALTLVAPYRRPFAHREEEDGPPLYRPYPFGFLFDLDLRETGDWFQQAMTLAWFDDLHLRFDAPGCHSVEAICEDGACRVR